MQFWRLSEVATFCFTLPRRHLHVDRRGGDLFVIYKCFDVTQKRHFFIFLDCPLSQSKKIKTVHFFSLAIVAIHMCAREARTYTRTYTYSLACLPTCIHTFIFHHAYVDTRMDTCTHMLTRNNISTTCCRLKHNAWIRDA